MQFYVAIEPEDFAYGEAREVEAGSIQGAAEEEACRVFDEDGVDPMRPVEVIVATNAKGAGAMRFTISRHVDVTHEIESETEIDIPLVAEET